MYKTLSLQCEQYIVIPVSMYKTLSLQGDNILLSCSTTFVSMYKTLSLQGEQYIVIL